MSLINPTLPLPQIHKRKYTTWSPCFLKRLRTILSSDETLIPLDNTVTSNSALVPNNILPSHNLIALSYNSAIVLLDDTSNGTNTLANNIVIPLNSTIVPSHNKILACDDGIIPSDMHSNNAIPLGPNMIPLDLETVLFDPNT
jgi:hypothetical protein